MTDKGCASMAGRSRWTSIAAVTWRALKVLLACLCVSLPRAPAAETDQYYAWGADIPDSMRPLNAKINDEIQIALDWANEIEKGRGYTCEGVAELVLWRFRFVGLHQIEFWAQVSTEVPSVPAGTCELQRYARKNIYRYNHPIWYPISFLSLGHTIRIDRVHLGTDKLGHFFRQGWRYYQVYREAIEEGKSEEEALELAVRFGISQEKGSLGMNINGIFSYGDLESNWQGFRFFRSLCRQEPARLERTKDGWRMTSPFDLQEYVNPGWDESFNNPAITRSRWKGVKRAMLDYCPRLSDPKVADQRRRYRETWQKSTSQQLLERWMESGEVPDPRPQSIEAVCGDAMNAGGSGGQPPQP